MQKAASRLIGPMLVLLTILNLFLRTDVSFIKAAGTSSMVRDLSGSAWQLQASNKLSNAKGADISQSSFDASSWDRVTVPTTVLAGLVANGVYKDPYFGTNLQSIDSKTFSDTTWWYRTTFVVPASEANNEHWLKFEGLSYRANIWLNGQEVANNKDVVGTFRDFEFNISKQVHADGTPNTLAVEISRPADHDLYLWFGDWIPGDVPDRDMGITGHVILTTTDAVRMRHPFVQTTFDDPTQSLSTAHLTVFTSLTNATGQSVSGQLEGLISSPNGAPPITFSKAVTLSANANDQEISISAKDVPQLDITNPAVWWPWQWGPQSLYTLSLSFVTSTGASDVLSTQFGIRQVTSKLDGDQHIQFSINGHPFLVRGAAWTPDMLLQHDSEPELAAQVGYMRDLNLNTIRLEGKLEEGDDFYQLCDQEGIMVMAGWMFGVGWEEWNKGMDGGGSYGGWDQEHLDVAQASLTTQMYKLRAHPSLLTWLNGSDNAPETVHINGNDTDVEKAYSDIEKKLHWPNPVMPDAEQNDSGPTSGAREGQWGWEPPVYFYDPKSGQRNGGAYGFDTEEGPGVEPLPVESMQQFLPANQLFPADNKLWHYHSGQNGFNTDFFSTALDNRYGSSSSIQDYSAKAQLQAYESTRAFFEAFGRNKPNGTPPSDGAATGVIHWMLNNAWPSMIWHLYDYYMRPGGAYFGAKVALEPLHIQYSYDDDTIWALNSDLTTHNNIQANEEVYSLDGQKLFNKSATIKIGPDGATQAFDKLSSSVNLPTTYILRLTLSENNRVKSINSYWLSTKKDKVDYSSGSCLSDQFDQYCSQSDYADLTALTSLPKITLATAAQVQPILQGSMQSTTITVKNPSTAIALAVHLKITKGANGPEVLPIEWQDNYFVLLPGETRTINAIYSTSLLKGTTPTISADCFNNIR